MQSARQAILQELNGILAETGLTPSRLARVAGIQHSTLTRFLKNKDAPILSSNTMFKLRQARDRIVAAKAFRIDPESLQDEKHQRAVIAALMELPAPLRSKILMQILRKSA